MNYQNLTVERLAEISEEFSRPALTFPTIRLSKNLVEQFRFPKTRKRRIRNKWAARPENWRASRKVYLDKTNSVLYVHPETFEKMMGGMEKLTCDYRRI